MGQLLLPPIIAIAAAGPSTAAQTQQQLTGDTFGAYIDSLHEKAQQQTPESVRELEAIVHEADGVDVQALKAARTKNGFQRSPEGLVYLRSKAGKWFLAKNDALAEGYLLLQDSGGLCYFLPPSEVGDLVQVDLSDDVVVAMLFHDGMWESVMRPIETTDENNNVVQVRLPLQEFRALLSLLGDI